MNLRCFPLLVLAAAMLAAAEPPIETPATGDPAALQRLLRGHAQPWYDPATDSWRRLDAPPPEPARTPREHGDGIDVTWIAVLLGIGAALALAWLVVVLLRERRPAPIAAAAATPATPNARLAELPMDLGGLDPEAALAAARQAGDWARAAMCVQARLLIALDHAGAIRLARGTTNRQYLRQLRAFLADHGTEADAVADGTAGVEAAWFGGHVVDAAWVDALDAAYQAVAVRITARSAR